MKNKIDNNNEIVYKNKNQNKNVQSNKIAIIIIK